MAETPQAGPQQQSNNLLQENEPRIDLKLLRALLDGVFISLQKILAPLQSETNPPRERDQEADTNASNACNTAPVSLQEVTLGSNNALHIVAGVAVSPIMIHQSEKETEPPQAELRQQANNHPPGNEREIINPKLLRVLLDGDLISLQNILESSDLERNTNARNVLQGVTFGGQNNALHVVAGVAEFPIEITRIEILYVAISLLTLLVIGALFHFYYADLIDSVVSTITIIFLKRRFPQIPGEDIYISFSVLYLLYQLNQFGLARIIYIPPAILMAKLLDALLGIKHRTIFFNVVNGKREKKYVEMVKKLNECNHNLLYAYNAMGETPLHCATKTGNIVMVSQLMKTALHDNKLKKLLRIRNKQGETALHVAARFGYSTIATMLLEGDKELAFLEHENHASPLYLATTSGSFDVVQALILHINGRKSEIYERPVGQTCYEGPGGQTALHAAVKRRNRKIIKKILEQDWDPSPLSAPDKSKNTPLHLAALFGNIYAVQKILSKDTDSVYRQNSTGSFPVHLAAEAGSFAAINEILKYCPDTGELLDENQRNSLHVAVEKKDIKLVSSACKRGINPTVMNAKDKDGNTPLHLAVKSADSEIFTLLFHSDKLNSNARNNLGQTPLELSATLQDHQFTYSRNPQSIIYQTLLTRGALAIPPRPEWVHTRSPEEDIREKESSKYENMSKSLITGAVLIASAAFTAIFTMSLFIKGYTLSPDNRRMYIAFVIVDAMALISAIVSTSWLLHSALTNFHIDYRKIYFGMSSLFLHGAISLFILAFGLGSYMQCILTVLDWQIFR